MHALRLVVRIILVLLCAMVLAVVLCTCNNEAHDAVTGKLSVELRNKYVQLDTLLEVRQWTEVDAATLAWREVPIVESYMTMWKVTGDKCYLDKAYSLIKAFFRNLEIINGFQGWTTDDYSVGLVHVVAAGKNAGTGNVIAAEDQITEPTAISKVTGYTYDINFEDPYCYSVYVNAERSKQLIARCRCDDSLGEMISEPLTQDHEWVHQVAEAGNNYWSVATKYPLLKNNELASLRQDDTTVRFGKDGDEHWNLRDDGRLNIWLPLGKKPWDCRYSVEYMASCNITTIPGVFLQVVGKPEAGDEFTVRTESARPLPHLVLDGMILQSSLGFVKAVLSDSSLDDRYGSEVRRWLDQIRLKIIPKWDKWWKEEGYYTFPDDLAYRYPGDLLPFNQFLAFGSALLLLYDIVGDGSYLERARKMAEYFKANLSLTATKAYTWRYSPIDTRPEDISHANLDIRFVFDSFERGVVFNESDTERFSRTLLGLMWNGSVQNPQVGSYVNGPTVIQSARNLRVQEWVLLATVDPQVWEVCRALIPKQMEQCPGDRNLSLQLIANLLLLQREGHT